MYKYILSIYIYNLKLTTDKINNKVYLLMTQIANDVNFKTEIAKMSQTVVK